MEIAETIQKVKADATKSGAVLIDEKATEVNAAWPYVYRMTFEAPARGKILRVSVCVKSDGSISRQVL